DRPVNAASVSTNPTPTYPTNPPEVVDYIPNTGAAAATGIILALLLGSLTAGALTVKRGKKAS
ncbi:MAG: hypothetical protein LBQ48_00475, partial [Oscillospiraceae bacterium]|nr:hypothetical protein [Oscillospiraceae bacterium]